MSDLDGIGVTAALSKLGLPVIAVSGADSLNDDRLNIVNNWR
jgi:hypothetical protein